MVIGANIEQTIDKLLLAMPQSGAAHTCRIGPMSPAEPLVPIGLGLLCGQEGVLMGVAWSLRPSRTIAVKGSV